MPPLIAVSASLTSEGRERVQLNASYVRAIEGAGGVPLLIPAQVSLATLGAIVGLADGLVLTGGGDVNPARYGEEPHPAVTGVSDDRDATEEAVVNLAIDRDIPILAICRGMQVLNVALGGTLIQDIPGMAGNAVVHASPDGLHAIRVAPSGRLASLVGAATAEVNSRHHQAVKALGDGLQAVAWASDGVIEGIEMIGHWVVGVQWHPEDMVEESDVARRLFAGLVEAAGVR